MDVYQGKSVFGGLAIGKIHVIEKKEQLVKRYRIEDATAEIARFQKARETAILQLHDLYEKAIKEIGEASAAIFDIHQMMLEDEDYINSIENMVTTQAVNAEYAVAVTGDNFAEIFSSMEDEYMRGRAADVKDISERMVHILKGTCDNIVGSNEPVIILAVDLAPSETVQLDKNKVLSFVTVHGSIHSHTAILARTMGIPAVVSTPVPMEGKLEGLLAAVDGDKGLFYLNPDEETLKKLKQQMAAEQEKKKLLLTMKGQKSISQDGHKVMLYANIGGIKDIALALQNDAEGVGLFRSEFLYLEKDHYPTEEEQFKVYKTAAELMAGKRVIIRTLDIGADKQASYFHLPKEENPALGYRAIRICLDRKEIFKTQLRAIFRASAYGKIAVMYPMIISVSEVHMIKALVEEVKNELNEEQLTFNQVEQGIMIETPAAVLIGDELAKEVDFFSIGTNDLTQYTLACDRQNERLNKFYDTHHPAVLRMIKMVAEHAHKNGIWCGICGELGADTSLTSFFLTIGIDELSVSPGSILPVRKQITLSKMDTEALKLIR